MSNIDKEALRMTHLSTAEPFKSKQRHGFFSVPITTAVGDDGPYKTKIHKRDEMGKPQTQPRQLQTNPTRSGQLAKSYLGPLNSLAEKKDPFVEVPKRLNQEDMNWRKLDKHEKKFYPANTYHLLKDSSYEYKEEMNPEKDPRRFRQQDGRVRSNPRQLQTNPQSRVLSDYFKPIKHVSDPINRKHDIEWEHYKSEKAKEGEAVFSPNKFSSDAFNSSKDLFQDLQYKRTRYFHQTRFSIGKHEGKWKDTNANRKGLYGYFTPFPEWIAQPPVEKTRKDRSNSGGKDVFKAMNRTTMIIPSASVTQHPNNLRKSLGHSFSHRPT